MLESPDLSMAVAISYMRIRIPEGKWSSGWEVVIFPIWKITLHCFGNMSKLLNPGRSPSSQTDTLFKKFIISEKDQLPFKTKAFVYDLKACTTQMEELNMFHVASGCCYNRVTVTCAADRVPGGGQVVMQAGIA